MIDKDVIIACDFSSKTDTLDFLDRFSDVKPYVKIGMELFYSEGPSIIKEIKARGHKIFLDLKLHDIPNTVSKAISNLAKLDIDMTNVHASGGYKMMNDAKNAVEQINPNINLIAVTQLTSTSEKMMHDQLLISTDIDMKSAVIKYALNVKTAGLAGVVCSPLEASAIKENCGEDFITCTPGIRFAEDTKSDQVRVTTPADAKAYSDFIVVGRSITASEDPVSSYNRCIQDFLGE